MPGKHRVLREKGEDFEMGWNGFLVGKRILPLAMLPWRDITPYFQYSIITG